MSDLLGKTVQLTTSINGIPVGEIGRILEVRPSRGEWEYVFCSDRWGETQHPFTTITQGHFSVTPCPLPSAAVTLSDRAKAVTALHDELEAVNAEQLAIGTEMARLIAKQVQLASHAAVLHKSLGILLS